ncbi:MAG: SDR family oxidoreductase [Cyclobacteriaceae bacterium]
MKTLIIGANGQIGSILAAKLKKSNHSPVLMLRTEKQIEEYKNRGYDTVLGDLEKDFGHAFEGVEAVVFTAGSGAHTGDDKTHLIDRVGAKKAVDEAIKHKAKRFIMVSAFGADMDSSQWPASMSTYYAAKADADKYLLQTNLDYTILLPGKLTNESGTGNVMLGDKLEQRSGSIPRADVASVITHIIDAKQTYGEALELLSGEVPVNAAIKSI